MLAFLSSSAAASLLVAPIGMMPALWMPPATDPLNATYIVEGQPAKPVYGNIDGKGDVDAALFLTYDPGGSGTFYYAAAALEVDGFYLGTHAILLGDRVAPQNISVRNGVIVANYATRRRDESLSAAPSVGTSTYLILEGNGLKETGPFTAGEVVVEGWVTIGHEVRSFVPCSPASALWLAGKFTGVE
jgi:hypothetical protein